MDLRHPGHVMSVDRCGHDLHEHPGADVEQRQKMSHGEAAAGLLPAGLAKVRLEFGCVGHGEAGAVGNEHAVPVPGPGVVNRGSNPVGNAAEQLPKQRQGQAAPSLAVGRIRELKSTDSNQMIDRRIAVEDLSEEQVDDRHGVEQTLRQV